MIKLACVGDNVVDINYLDKIINPGGNCVNVAVYAAQLGHQSGYVGVLADDKFAEILKGSFDQTGVSYNHCPVLQGETGRCFVDLIDGDRVLGDENDGGLVKSDPLQLTDEVLDYLKSFDLVHTSCYSYMDDQLFRYKNAGISVVYDFSTAWNEEKFRQVCPYVDYVLLSGKEEDIMEEDLAVLRELTVNYPVQLAIITFGVKGAYVYDGSRLHFKEPYNAEGGAIDTTGCGDSWIAGFITTYAEGAKRLNSLKQTARGDFLQEKNEKNYLDYLIEISMCMGNAKARHTSQIKGGYGHGKTFAEFGNLTCLK